MTTNEEILAEVHRSLALLRPAQSPLALWMREHVTRPMAELLSGLGGFLARIAGFLGGRVLLVLLALAAALLLFLLVRLLFRRGQAASRALAEDRIARRGPVLRDPAEAEGEAASLAGAGRFREAVRLLYMATFVRLHRRSGRPFDPSLTPGENLRAFRSEPCFPGLRGFVGGYVEASFGDRPLDAGGYRDLADLRPPEGAP